MGNVAGDNGGAIYASGRYEYTYPGAERRTVSTVAHLDVGGSAVFSGNRALGSYGGAISIEGQGTLAIHGRVRFEGNTGLVQAGAVHVNSRSEARISGRAVMDSNFAPSGGALYADGGSTIRLSDSALLVNNSAQVAGGGIAAATGSLVSLSDNASVSLSSAPRGGAVYLDRSAMAIAGHARLADNRAGAGGMAYMVNSASSTISDWAVIENNQADSEGGGVFASDSSLDVSGTAVIAGNRAGGSGGAVAARASASVRVSGAAALLGNTARTAGGAIDADTSVVLRLDGRSSVKLNRAANGGGISLRSVQGHIQGRCLQRNTILKLDLHERYSGYRNFLL